MPTFNTSYRFKILEGDTYYASAGTQTNCSGIAAIVARIEQVQGLPEIQYSVSHSGKTDYAQGSSIVPGGNVPKEYRDAVFKGAADAFEHCGISQGYSFVLLEALVHPVDAREMKFREAGARLVCGWWTTVRKI